MRGLARLKVLIEAGGVGVASSAAFEIGYSVPAPESGQPRLWFHMQLGMITGIPRLYGQDLAGRANIKEGMRPRLVRDLSVDLDLPAVTQQFFNRACGLLTSSASNLDVAGWIEALLGADLLVSAQVFQLEAVWKTHLGIGRVQREPA
jgi:hypothetical protein